MAFGVTLAGFAVKPLETCLSELQALARGTFGAAIKVNPSSRWGQFLGILSEREALIWAALQDVYTSRDPAQATGDALDSVCALTGTVRKAATASSAAATITGTPGTVIPAGKVASVTGTAVRFALLAEVTIGGGGTVAAIFDAENTGALAAPAGTLETIETPVAGWSSVTNAADATLGRERETDPALRVRRLVELTVAGKSTLDAIRAAVLGVSAVTSCSVFENVTDSTDGEGLPPHSIQVLASGGADADIRAAIWGNKPAGIETYGAVTGSVDDSESVAHTVKFDRPTVVNVYLIVNLKKGAAYPSDGDTQVKAALAAWGQANLADGTDVTAWALKRSIGISGVMDVPTLYLGTSASPGTEATIGITSRQRASLDTARITVNATAWSETP